MGKKVYLVSGDKPKEVTNRDLTRSLRCKIFAKTDSTSQEWEALVSLSKKAYEVWKAGVVDGVTHAAVVISYIGTACDYAPLGSVIGVKLNDGDTVTCDILSLQYPLSDYTECV